MIPRLRLKNPVERSNSVAISYPPLKEKS